MAARLSFLVRTTLNTALLKPPWQTLFHPKCIRSSGVYTSIKVGCLRFKSTQKLTSEKDDSLHQQSLRNKIWNENFERIKEHVQNIATKDTVLGNPLTKWVYRQRRRKQNKDLGLSSTLTDDQEEKLESLGLLSGDKYIPYDVTWNTNFELLKEHIEKQKEKEPDNPYCVQTPPEDRRLNTWLNRQRNLNSKHLRGHDLTTTEKERLIKLESLGIRLGYRDAEWERMYLQLKAFYKRKNCFPRYATIDADSEEDRKLLSWCVYHKKEYSYIQENGYARHITQERIDQLDAIGFEWDYDAWTKRYEELVEYYKEHGHSMVPTESQTHKELGKWVAHQRLQYNKIIQSDLTKGTRLSNERICLLNELDFVWDVYEHLWTKRYEELVEYYKEHGHTMVSQERETHKELSMWVYVQRRCYKERIQGKPQGFCMTNERIRLLNELDFVWDPREDIWTKRYEDLKEYYAEHGHSMVPAQSETYKELGVWVQMQRQCYKQKIQGNLPKEIGISNKRIRLLNEVDFVWDTREVRWRTQYQKLVEYAKQHGRGAFINDKRIHKWLIKQRKKYVKWKDGRKSTMTQERADLLEKLGYTFDESDAD
jgi:hypothetical protein